MAELEQTNRWQWDCYNFKNLLIGPLKYIKSPSRYLVPDYSCLGVSDRIKIEVDFYIDQEKYRN